MTDTEFAAALKKGELSGVYIVCGDEAYLKRHYVREMRKRGKCADAYII